MRKKQIKLTLFWTLLFFFANASFGVNYGETTYSDSLYYLRNPVYKYETSMYRLNKLKNPEIIAFGDSHIQSARWSELLGNYRVINRGIAGDDTEGMKHRLDGVIKLNPKIVFIEGGINDVYNWVGHNIIIHNLEYIIKTLKANGITVIVNSIIYAGRRWGEEWIKKNNPEIDVVKYNFERNKVVKNLNRDLKRICRENNVYYIDLNKKLTANGFLKDIYTKDQLHLNARGYQIWARELLNVLKQIKGKRN